MPVTDDFWIEVLSDDRCHGVVVASFEHFDDAVRRYGELIAGSPPMRLVMRKMAHVYRNYIPARLHNSYDRSAEYPM